MWHRRGCTVLAGAVGLVWVAAQAHQSGEERADKPPALLDCDSLPSRAVTVLPEPISEWAQLACRPTGQLVVGTPRWQWRYPASYTTRVILPASIASPEAPGARYFTTISSATLTRADAARLHAGLRSEMAVYADHADPEPPGSVHVMTASNDLGDELRVYFFPRGSDGFLGVVCAARCIPESTFLVQSHGG